MAYRVLPADEAHWRPSNQMRVENTDLAEQLGAQTLGARYWRLRPGQASTKHRHRTQDELYVVLEGTGRIRIDDEVVTLPPALVGARRDRARPPGLQRHRRGDVLWLVVGAPPEPANTLEMTADELAHLYPDGPKALPPELGGGQAP